jgi:GH25 family lysozyme M1 (1,4-beta-N-acetylmuramidase)
MNSNCDHFWTTGGHYVTAVGYDDKGYIYAADPNKSSCPRKQKDADFEKCLKQAWILWPAKKEEETHDPFERVDDGKAQERGTAIIDVSKWQPSINYDKFIKDTALIILRVGRRGTGGSVKIDECFIKHADALKKRGIRFGVYFYSIANTGTKAREEARSFVKWAKDYSPLFWAMDAEKKEITHEAIAVFADAMRKQGVKKLGCYVAHNLYQKYGYDGLRPRFDFTWIPRYGANRGTIESSIKPDFPCDMWQFTSTGKVAGISGNVDMNVITGTGKPLEWFLGGEE